MLRIRVLTAAFLAPLFVLGVLFLPGGLFAVFLGLAVLPGAWEWTRLSGYDDNRRKILAVAVVLALMAAAYSHRESAGEAVLLVAWIAWVVAGVCLLRWRHVRPLRWPRPLRWLCGAWVMVPAWLALVMVQRSMPAAALMLFVLVWAADTGAYFTGRRWGRRRLALAISPGKTLEGVAGAMAAAPAAALVFGWWWGMDAGAALALMACSGLVIMMSVLGDLFESNWKRVEALKDSGTLLPGHGGVLDRIDSILAAAPPFALGWLWWFESAVA